MLCRNDLEDNIAAYIKDRLPQAEMRTVFDVGANVGWFTFQFGKVYRDAAFHLFEPVSSIFDAIPATLAKATDAGLDRRSTLNHIAMGHEAGVVTITSHPGVTVNHIVSADRTDGPTEIVDVVRGDDYCARNGIRRVNYLKIDAEGFDMNVLMGFAGMLSRGNIDFVQVEAAVSRDNHEHVHVDAFAAVLGNFGYQMFRIINQASTSRVPILTRADVVFIREVFARALAEAH